MGIAKRPTAAGAVRYEVRLRGPDGRERSRTFRTRKAAETYQRELLAQRDRGGRVDPKAGRISLDEWVTEWSATSTFAHRRGGSTSTTFGSTSCPSSVPCS